METVKVLETVGDLIKYLETLGRNRTLIYDSDGNTDNVDTNDIVLWNPSDDEGPVALIARDEI